MQTRKLIVPVVMVALSAAISTFSIITTAQVTASGSDFVVSRMDTTVDDSVITSRIKDALAANKDASSLKLQVTTTQGVVTLSGTAPSVEAVSNVLKLVAAIDGVKDIQNRIKVKAS